LEQLLKAKEERQKEEAMHIEDAQKVSCRDSNALGGIAIGEQKEKRRS
jgi:hypothetical protein